MTPSSTGLVTAVLEAEVIGELRRRGIVVWLDRDGHYSSFVDCAAERHREGTFPYPVVGFRGSFLELMLALEGHAAGLDPTPLLVHMPGFTEDTIRATPLLELYKVGFRYRRALDTLVREAATGKVSPTEVDAFLVNEEPTLAAADEWLARAASQPRTGLAELLDRTSLEVVIRELLVKDTFLSGHLSPNRAEGLAALSAYLARQVGLDDSWLSFISGVSPQEVTLDALVDALASWLLCVEYVDDLTGAPTLAALRPLASLPKAVVTLCREQVGILRDQHPTEYEAIADQVEAHLEAELTRVEAKHLGRVDTFRFEEETILKAAIAALAPGGWATARQWAEARAGGGSFWLRRDQRRRLAWDLVTDAAHLGCLLEESPRPFAGVAGLQDAMERYTGAAFRVDQAHRVFEQRRASRLQPQLPHFAGLKEVVGRLRRLYRAWADELAVDFSVACRATGLLPDASLQQRHFFEHDVLPMARSSERVAILLVDSLRYEMAAELAGELAEPGAKVTLTARYAELPTITAVGMNALAPVSRNGRLQLAGAAGFKGFTTGELAVDDPGDRANAMGLRYNGERALSLSLTEVCEAGPESLRKRVAQKRLTVVHERALDEAGEAGVGLAAFEQVLAQVKAAWLHLKGAGVTRLVISSDHGFLLQDETTTVRPYGKRTDPCRRYVLSPERRVEDGLVTASLAELAYDGRDGFLLFTEDTTAFDGPGAGATFMHGGNSPQERIVPVLAIVSTRPGNADLSAFVVEAAAAADALDYHRLNLRLLHDRAQSPALPFPRSEPVELAIRAVGRPEVRATVVGASGLATERRGRVQTPVAEQWSEVFFILEGPHEERVQVEVLHPDGIDQVTACSVEGWFQVKAVTAFAPASAGRADEGSEEWSASIQDVGARRIFVHLSRHGAITEAEAVEILGSPRRFRQFSSNFEQLCALTPLRVRIEVTPTGKRYVREGRGS